MEHTGPSSVLWLLCYFWRFKGSKHPRVKPCVQLSGDAAPFLGCVPPGPPGPPTSLGRGQTRPSLQPHFLPRTVSKEILVKINAKESREKRQFSFSSLNRIGGLEPS